MQYNKNNNKTTQLTLITTTGIMATTSSTTNNYEKNKEDLYQRALSANLEKVDKNVDIILSKLEVIAKNENKIQSYSRLGIQNQELGKPDRFLDSKIQMKLRKTTRKLSLEVGSLSRPIMELKGNLRNIHCLIVHRNFNFSNGQLELKAEDFNRYFILEDVLTKINIFLSNFENYNTKKRILCCCNLVNSLCNVLEAFDSKGKGSMKPKM